MPVFFIPSTAIQGNTITLGDQLFTHIHKSLRVCTGQSIWVCDENRQRHSVTIVETTKNYLIGEIEETLAGPPKDIPTLTLAQSIIKNENMAWGIQKATELGVDTITPIITERGQNRLKNKPLKHFRERWQRIAIEAAQQSERWDVPTILPPVPFHDFLQDQSSGQLNFILTERERPGPTSMSLGKEVQTVQSIVLAVGPEGGWIQQEIQEAEDSGFTKITLGEQVLRSETAAITGVILIQEQLKHVTFKAITEP